MHIDTDDKGADVIETYSVFEINTKTDCMEVTHIHSSVYGSEEQVQGRREGSVSLLRKR